MGGSSHQPKESDSQREAEELQKELLEAQLEQAKKPLELGNLKPPPPLPPAAPPPLQTSADVAQAEEEARRAALRRTNAGRGTLFAGENSNDSRALAGSSSAASLGGTRTLLG